MADQNQNTKRESGYYWVPRAHTCNGCKFLNFAKQGCRRNQPPGEVRPLTTYLNGDGYLALIKPSDCDWDKDGAKKKAEASQDADMSQDSGGKEEAV